MNAKRILLALFALASTAAAPEDGLAFGASAGDTVTKRFEAKYQAAFEEVELVATNNGETIERSVPMDSSVERRLTLVLSDHYESLEPLRLTRSVDEALRVDDLVLQGRAAPAAERVSRFQETAVLVEWAPEEEEPSFEQGDSGDGDAEELDERVYETLRPDADFRFFLPAEEVDAGDTWTIASEHVRDLLSPGGDLFPFLAPEEKLRAPEGTTEAQLQAPFAGMTIPPYQWMLEPEGEIEVTYQGQDEDEPELALLAFELELEGALDPMERLDYHVARGMPAFIEYEYEHDFQFEISGQGILRWDLERGLLHDLSWGAEITGSEEIHLAAAFDDPKTGDPVDVDMNIQGDWKGHYSLSGGLDE